MKKYNTYQKKIFLNSCLPFLLVIGLGTVVYFAIIKTAGIKQSYAFTNELRNTFNDLNILKDAILLTYNADNRLSYDSDKKSEQKLKDIESNFVLLTEKINSEKLLDKNNSAVIYDSIKANFERQVNGILQLNALLKQIGTESSGMMFDIVNSGRQIAESLSSTESADMLKTFQDMLLAQNFFLINKDKTSLNNLLTEVNSLKAFMASLENGTDEISAKTNNYIVLANSLLELSHRAGFRNYPAGLIPEYNKVNKVTCNLIDRLDIHFGSVIKTRRFYATLIFASAGIIIFLTVTLIYLERFRRLIYYPIDEIVSSVKKLVRGVTPEKEIRIKTKDELEELGNNLNKIAQSISDKTLFLNTLNQNNLDAKLELLSKDDKLGKALLDIQVKIRQSADEQKKHDDENLRRRYINEGLARFSDITHARYDNIEDLTDIFIKELVKYLNSLQGGVFLTKEADGTEELYLASAFAFDRKKYLTKTVALGEGLVGTCALEKRLIMITEVPADYISITSGLGDAPPDTILLIPMLQDKILGGVIEIASLNKFKEHQIEFVKQVANNLANTLASARINEKTSKLLTESQLHAQTMSEQEEEMRQNMEELKATQEESARREEEFRGIAEALEKSVFVAEFDLKGHLISINEKFMVFLGKKAEQLIGKTFDKIIGNEKDAVLNENSLDEVLNGKHLVITEKIRFGKKKDYKVQFHFTVEINRNEFPFKILCLGIEILS